VERSFKWCRQEIAEFCLEKEEHVHVAVTTPAYRMITPKCGRPTLNMRFWDLNPHEIRKRKVYKDDPVEGEEFCSKCFSPDQAKQLLDFIGNAPQGHLVVVNCEAGISRSAGIVLALRTYYGGDIEEIFEKAYPNLYVADTLGKLLGVGPFPPREPEGVEDLFGP